MFRVSTLSTSDERQLMDAHCTVKESYPGFHHVSKSAKGFYFPIKLSQRSRFGTCHSTKPLLCENHFMHIDEILKLQMVHVLKWW